MWPIIRIVKVFFENAKLAIIKEFTVFDKRAVHFILSPWTDFPFKGSKGSDKGVWQNEVHHNESNAPPIIKLEGHTLG